MAFWSGAHAQHRTKVMSSFVSIRLLISHSNFKCVFYSKTLHCTFALREPACAKAYAPWEKNKQNEKKSEKINWNPQPKFRMNAKRGKRASGYQMMVGGARRLSIIINSLNYFYFCYFGKAFCWHITNAFWTNWDAEKWHLPPQELRYSTQLLPSDILHSAFVCAASVWYIDSVNPMLCCIPIHLTCGRTADSHVMKQFIFNEFIDEAKWNYENRIRIECDYWIGLCVPLLQLIYSALINSAANKREFTI